MIFFQGMLLAILAFGLAWAQDVDTVVLKSSEKFTIVSQIQDKAEAEAFLAIRRAQESAQRYKLAQDFITAYPKSWLLAQAYDASARSAIDLERYDDALSDGRFSLRLVPENPSLLVLMANVEAQKNLLQRATTDATVALEYLNEFEPAENLSELKSSAYFARARAEANQDAAAALRDLNYAVAWNPSDTEVFYLRAIVEIRMGDQKSAAADMAFVTRVNGPLREKAQKVLGILGVRNAGPPAVDTGLRRAIEARSSKALEYGYAGPETCKGCHADEYAAWRKTGMSKMLQPYKRENVIGDFTGTYQDSVRMDVAGRPYFEIAGVGGWSRYYVDFTIGSKWQQAYATKLADGRLQVLPIQYNALKNSWINYWAIIDPPGSTRATIREFPKLTTATNYQQNCAICHTSQLKITQDSMEHAAYLQPGVDCEMCHGPSAWHVKHPKEPPLEFKKVSNREAVRVCAQCHRQSAVREFGQGGEMNYSTSGNFVQAAWLRPTDAFSRKAFYKDGRFRETTFIVEAFTRSACYLRGKAECNTCHSPHLANFEANQTSLKFKDSPNEMCLGCHSEYRKRIATHSHHTSGSEASECVTCHMPRIMNALLFQARSHQIETPTVDLTERFGQAESPNVCLTCHAEKNVAWAKEKLAQW